MTETVRSYSGIRLSAGRRRRRRRTGRVVLLLALLGVLYGLWTTRDSCPAECLIPAGQAYQVVTHDLLAQRDRLVQSKIWDALPSFLGLAGVPERLQRDTGVPAWVLRNLIPGTCFVTGSDLSTFSDTLFVSRMTRVGCLLERALRLTRRVESDAAGGLRLRSVPDSGLYYAVRGRSLAVCRSRDALIRALTLRPEDALSPEAAAALAKYGVEDLCGTVAFGPDDAGGRFVRGGSFAIRVEPEAVTLKCRAVLRPEWEAQVRGLFEGVSPQPLTAPPAGVLELSANLGKPLQETWAAAGRAVDRGEACEALWARWAGTPGLPQTVTSLLGPLGPGFRLTWTDIDLNEIVPVPELAATFDADPEAVRAAFAALPAPPADALPWDSHLRYDAENERVYLPMPGGPSIEPTAGLYGNALLVSTSRTLAEALLNGGPPPQTLPEPGNLFVRVRPYPCLKAIADAGALFEEARLLKESTRGQLQELSTTWMEYAAGIEEISALAAYEDGEVSVRLVLVCAPGA